MHLMEKILGEWKRLNRQTGGLFRLIPEQNKRIMACQQVLAQQRILFSGGKVSQRIVSIDRSYIRPIVR